jgi:hypothetical protein
MMSKNLQIKVLVYIPVAPSDKHERFWPATKGGSKFSIKSEGDITECVNESRRGP